MIQGIAHRLAQDAFNQVVIETYGDIHHSKLPRQALQLCRLNPAVTKYSEFKFAGRLGTLRPEQITDAEVDKAYSAAVDALTKLGDLIAAGAGDALSA